MGLRISEVKGVPGYKVRQALDRAVALGAAKLTKAGYVLTIPGILD